LEEAGDRLFTFTRLPESQWKSARTTDEIDKSDFSQAPFFCPGQVPNSVARSDGQGWPQATA